MDVPPAPFLQPLEKFIHTPIPLHLVKRKRNPYHKLHLKPLVFFPAPKYGRQICLPRVQVHQEPLDWGRPGCA